jgi:hypothetical protein
LKGERLSTRKVEMILWFFGGEWVDRKLLLLNVGQLEGYFMAEKLLRWFA